AEAPVEGRGRACDETEVRNDDLPSIIETIMIKHCRESQAKRVGAVWEQQSVPASAILSPSRSEFLRERLWQTLDTRTEDTPQRRPAAAPPFCEPGILILPPRTQ